MTAQSDGRRSFNTVYFPVKSETVFNSTAVIVLAIVIAVVPYAEVVVVVVVVVGKFYLEHESGVGAWFAASIPVFQERLYPLTPNSSRQRR